MAYQGGKRAATWKYEAIDPTRKRNIGYTPVYSTASVLSTAKLSALPLLHVTSSNSPQPKRVSQTPGIPVLSSLPHSLQPRRGGSTEGATAASSLTYPLPYKRLSSGGASASQIPVPSSQAKKSVLQVEGKDLVIVSRLHILSL